MRLQDKLDQRNWKDSVPKFASQGCRNQRCHDHPTHPIESKVRLSRQWLFCAEKSGDGFEEWCDFDTAEIAFPALLDGRVLQSKHKICLSTKLKFFFFKNGIPLWSSNKAVSLGIECAVAVAWAESGLAVSPLSLASLSIYEKIRGISSLRYNFEISVYTCDKQGRLCEPWSGFTRTALVRFNPGSVCCKTLMVFFPRSSRVSNPVENKLLPVLSTNLVILLTPPKKPTDFSSCCACCVGISSSTSVRLASAVKL